MGKQYYKRTRFTDASLDLIEKINAIIVEYVEQGFRLTVRQLYYQLVAKALIENTMKSYKSTTALVTNARLAGLIDWDAIEDRTRAFVRQTRWDSGKQILTSAQASFHMDMWYDQPQRVFVIIEKEALVGVLEKTCWKYDVPLLAARGFPSASVLREFAQQDLLTNIDQELIVIHLGDHDPSGLDMTRDLRERLELFCEDQCPIHIDRLALTMKQIQERNPPPNPAKESDPRFPNYQRQFGDKSWELDALPPQYLARIVGARIRSHIDDEKWDVRAKQISDIKERLGKTATRFRG